MAIILPCPRTAEETIDHYCRRRPRQARNVSQQIGFWSALWCNRVINWEEHLKRGARYSHFCSKLLHYHGESWLQDLRSSFVPENSEGTSVNRNTLFSGRTGSRLNIGRPQIRWTDSCSIARSILEARAQSVRGRNARTIGTIIKEAVDAARAFVNCGNLAADQPRNE